MSRPATPPEVRFWSKVSLPDDLGECWLWRNAHCGGYPQLWVYGKVVYAYRFAYSLVKKIDPDLSIDHLCGNTMCVNPMHMEQVTLSENTRRAHVNRRGSPALRR